MQQLIITVAGEGPDAIANALTLVAQRLSDGRGTGKDTMPDGTLANYALFHVPPTAEGWQGLSALAEGFEFHVGLYGRAFFEQAEPEKLRVFLPLDEWVATLSDLPAADAAHVLAVLFHPHRGLPVAARECLAQLAEDEEWRSAMLGAAAAADAPITVRWLASIMLATTTR